MVKTSPRNGVAGSMTPITSGSQPSYFVHSARLRPPTEIADDARCSRRESSGGIVHVTASSRNRTKSPGTIYGPRTSATPTDEPLLV